MEEHRTIKGVQPSVIIGTPGRMNDHLSKQNFDADTVTTLVIDEFDKCLEFGDVYKRQVPKSCKLVDSVWSTVFDVFACLLAGDDEEVYWCCGRLADRSIVVMDGAGRYYHVVKGKRKRYIAANLPEPGEQDFDTAVKKVKEEADVYKRQV